MPALRLPEPPLRDGDIFLRAWSLSDVEGLTVACQDPEIPRWTVVPSPYTEQHARDFIAGCAGDRGTGSELALAIVDSEDRLLGAIGIGRFDWDDGKAEIGYWIARERRRQAVGARATRLLARWALTVLGLARLELLANPENQASQRLAERAGFTREGLLRSYRRRHGRREALVMFSLLAEDLG